jgi:hypothetical protein
MRTSLSRIFIIGSLLALLCLALQSSPASAHTSSAAFGPPSRAYDTVTYLKRGNWGNYYFAPTYITMRAYAPLVIVNQTGRDVTLTDNMRFAGVLVRGGVYRTSFYGGMYRFNDIQQNIRVPLTIYVQGGYWRGGGYDRGYPGGRYW